MIERIRAARERLRGHAHVTPVLTSRTLDRRVGARVYVKCENFQRGGAFKFRGAFFALSRLTDAERRRGVVTFSSGNHAQALALAGRELGVPVTVVMPADASRTKRAATEGYGARVVAYDPEETTRETVALALAEERGCLVVPPFDHPDVIAGQGTAALELLDAVPDLGLLLVPCGGGGLLAGSAVAARAAAPGCRVVGVEPALADDATRSFRSGVLQRVRNPATVADGLRTASLGRLTFPLIREHVAAMVTVDEAAIEAAVRFFFYRMKLVVEPSGAVGLAALLGGAMEAAGAVGVLVSGGNVDGGVMARILEAPASSAAR